MKVDVKTNKRCAFCKYWYDPANSCIRPTQSSRFWEFDANVKQKCLKTNTIRSSISSCNKYECKIPIV